MTMMMGSRKCALVYVLLIVTLSSLVCAVQAPIITEHKNGSVSFSFTDIGEDTVLHYRYADSLLWRHLNISYEGRHFLEGLRLEGPYDYYIEDINGVATSSYQSFFMTRGNDRLANMTSAVVKHGNEWNYYCNPYAEDPDFSCDSENVQAQQILRFLWAYKHTDNESYLDFMYSFIFADYEDLGDLSRCAHEKADFDCEYSGDYFNSSGAEKQGLLIKALWEAFHHTGNESIQELAVNYTLGSPEGCHVWEGDFACDNWDDQGYLAEGFWTAYHATWNQSFYDIAYNLSEQALLAENSVTVLPVLAMAYEFTGEERFLDGMESLGDNIAGECITEACELKKNIIW